MSLRFRLVLLTVVLVTLSALSFSGLYLNSLVNTLSASARERGELASQQVNSFLIDHLRQHSGEYPPPLTLEETKAMWHTIAASDRDVSTMLERTMALSPALVEINIAGEDGRILTSSNPTRIGAELPVLGDFASWQALGFYQRILELITRGRDYQVVVPLGIAGQTQPVFTIQVVTSSVLLRSAVLPELETLGVLSGGILLFSLLLTAFATSQVLSPVKRIEQIIDRIAQGNFHSEDSTSQPQGELKEFAAVESKLKLLGQQFSGTAEGPAAPKPSLDELVDRMESQLDVATRLAAIGRLTGGVAHEIKNPLNAISLRLDLLRARVEESDAQLIPEIDVLSKEVRRLDRVVKTFLDFSRPVDVRFAEVDLAAAVAEVTNLVRPQARAANIEVSLDVSARVSHIQGDADLLKQAILNLMTNAIEAMKDGGQLRVTLYQQEYQPAQQPDYQPSLPSADKSAEMVVLEIADTGNGIPPELRDKVFQLYFTTKERGSGIGLAMTFRAVQLHNGTVEFWSENGKGTTFRLQFPALARYA